MGHLSAAIRLDVSVDEAFDAFASADALAQWFPGVRAVVNVTGPLDLVGTTYTLRFSGGVRADCTVIAVDRPTLHVRTFHRHPLGVRGRARMRFRADDGSTLVELDGEYSLPLGRLGRAVERLVPGAGDRGARAELTRFKSFLDSAPVRPR